MTSKRTIPLTIEGFLGCYENDLQQHEFNSYAAHLKQTDLTPKLCVSACSAISFNLAAIERGTMCFCKKENSIDSIKEVDLNCMVIPCAGDPNLACGSNETLLVYAAGALSTVIKILICIQIQ